MEVVMNANAKEGYAECRNPATGDTLGYIRRHTDEELKTSIEKARRVQPAWQAMPVKERIRRLRPVRQYLMDHTDELAEIISRNNGKTRVDALATEVLPSLMAFTYYSKHARTFLKTHRLRAGNLFLINKRSRIVRIPFGVVGIVTPWNYPFSIPFLEIIPALLAGNAVVARPADETALVTKALDDCFKAADLPDGVFACLNMPGPGFGEQMLDYGVDKLFFTGSVAVGKKLMAKAAQTLTPVVLELGGNDAMIVCEDADLVRAANGVLWAGMQNAGQSCGGVERIYVHESVYGTFLALLKEKVKTVRVGPDRNFDVDIGTMTLDRQVETVRRHISDALEKGATIVAQSEVSGETCPRALPAMLLAGVDHTMLLMKDESFGPVAGMMKYRTEDEAVSLANDSSLGLSASVWSTNSGRAIRMAARIKAGAVMINDHLMSHGLAETPWGGFKESGIGRTHGRIGFDEMTQVQVIVYDILPFVKKDLWWYPFDKKVYDGIKGVAQVLYGRMGKKITGLAALARILPRMFKS